MSRQSWVSLDLCCTRAITHRYSCWRSWDQTKGQVLIHCVLLSKTFLHFWIQLERSNLFETCFQYFRWNCKQDCIRFHVSFIIHLVNAPVCLICLPKLMDTTAQSLMSLLIQTGISVYFHPFLSIWSGVKPLWIAVSWLIHSCNEVHWKTLSEQIISACTFPVDQSRESLGYVTQRFV